MKHTAFSLSVLAAALAGCASPPKASVETFQVPPEDWYELGAVPGETGLRPAELPVRNGHLELSGNRTVLDPTPFGEFRGHVDVAISGGDRLGFAGLFLASPDWASYEVLAVRPSGEWRYYRSAEDPRSPVGGRGWLPTARESACGFWRLGMALQGGVLSLSVDGQVVEQARVLSPAEADDEDGWRVGVFTYRLRSQWNNFLFGEAGPEGAFNPASFEYWGSMTVAHNCRSEFRELAKRFVGNPTHMGVFAMAAALEAALKISDQEGEQGFWSETLREGRSVVSSSSVRSAARRVGEEGLLVRAFRRTASTAEDRRAILGLSGTDPAALGAKAERDGRLVDAMVHYATALEVEDDPKLRTRMAELKKSLPELKYRFELETSNVRDEIVSPREFQAVVRGIYGGLRASEDPDAQLAILLRVNRSNKDITVQKAPRRIPLAAGGKALSPRLEAELEQLRRRFREELQDAQARAEIVRSSSKVLGPGVRASLRSFTFVGKTFELHIDDGKQLTKLYERFAELLRQREKLGGKSLGHEEVPAELRTVSLLVEITFSVFYEGQRLFEVKGDRTYLGFEEWQHQAYPDRGIEESRFIQSELEQNLERFRRRVLTRFRTRISRENVVSKLPDSAKLPFLFSLARGTRLTEDRAGLEWQLEEQHGLRSDLRQRVTKRLLD